MTYWRLHYHLIWATFERQPVLTLEREKVFYVVLYKKAQELEVKIHAAGNIEDHVHVVASIPPKLSIADCVRYFKGASSFSINHMKDNGEEFKWQAGYGALTIGERSLETVKEYAARQKEHHQENKIINIYETIDDRDV